MIEAIIKKAIEDKTFSERINHMPHVKKARTIMTQRVNSFRQRNILLEKHLSREVQDTEEQYFGLKVAQVSGKAEPQKVVDPNRQSLIFEATKSKQKFYKEAKTAFENKPARREDYVEFYRTCTEANVVPKPIFTKI